MKFSEYHITDKNTAHGYGEHFYDKLLEPYLNEPINLLELGVKFGPSILAFAQVLKQARIYGIDIDLSQNRFKDQQDATGRVKLIQADLYKHQDAILKELGLVKFQIIIDDASHAAINQANAFRTFYPRLNTGGTYVIEDCVNPDFVIEEIKPFVGGGTIEVIDLRKFKNKLRDDLLIVVTKYSRPILL